MYNCARSLYAALNRPHVARTSTYSSHLSGISITLRPTTALTPGDVLREVDGLGILAPADFLVVQAGYVGNILLAEKVKEFTTWRKEDPTVCMSCVVTPRKSPWVVSARLLLASPCIDMLLYDVEQQQSLPFMCYLQKINFSIMRNRGSTLSLKTSPFRVKRSQVGKKSKLERIWRLLGQ